MTRAEPYAVVQRTSRDDIAARIAAVGLVAREWRLAWFRRDTGRWLGERLCVLPQPSIDTTLVGDARTGALNAWIQDWVPHLDLFTVEETFDLDAWDACLSGDAVCVDVTRFGWPTGDHVYHDWNDATRVIDWPDRCVRKYIEVRLDTLDVIANQSSHRPIRDSVPGQVVVDITETPFAAFHGSIFGRFVWRGDRWGFTPTTRGLSRRRAANALLPAQTRRALAATPVTFDFLGGDHGRSRERVQPQRSEQRRRRARGPRDEDRRGGR